MDKPKYTPNVEVELWKFFDNNQDMSFTDIGAKFGLSGEQARHLSLRWAMGEKEGFKKQLFSMLDGSPTTF